MALRMAVNDEQGELDQLLRIGPELLKSGGRMVVLSFMSIDDRKVKREIIQGIGQGRARYDSHQAPAPTQRRRNSTECGIAQR